MSGSSTTVVVLDRRPSQTVQDRGATVHVRTGTTPVQVRDQRTPVQVEDRRPTVKTGNNIGPRGPQGERGADAEGAIPPHPYSWGDAPQAVFTAPVDGILTIVRLQQTVPFNGVGASIQVGLTVDPDALLPAAWVNPYSAHEFENTPDLPLIAGDQVRLTIAAGTASQGAGILFLSFVPT